MPQSPIYATLLFVCKKPFIAAVNAYCTKGCCDKDRKHSHRKHYLPQGRPRDIGTEPIAACTVAFGIYAVTQKSFSLRVSFVPRRHIHTPTALKISAPKIRSTAATPAVRV